MSDSILPLGGCHGQHQAAQKADRDTALLSTSQVMTRLQHLKLSRKEEEVLLGSKCPLQISPPPNKLSTESPELEAPGPAFPFTGEEPRLRG